MLIKLNTGHALDDMVLDYDTVSKMPSVKVTPFVNSYKTYYSKVEEFNREKDPDSQPVLLLRLLLTQLKIFSRKFGGSYTSIKETITAIAHSMKVVVPKLNKSKFKEAFNEQEKALNLLRVNDDNPICSAEIRILQEIVQIGELVVAIISFNLDFMLTKTTNSNVLIQMIKNCGIDLDHTFIKNDLTFDGKSYEFFIKQVELFKIIKKESKTSIIN